jgi:hypothetical protein
MKHSLKKGMEREMKENAKKEVRKEKGEVRT